MIKARNSSGADYECKYDWPCFVQSGESGVVFSKAGNYSTAFFEAFPKEPSCFLRGEGDTIEQAEKQCWEKYQKVLTCEHEMERRDRKDGYGYCKHCSYSSMVFEPLTKCCKCKIPTRYGQDYKGRHYCKKHASTKPNNPNATKWDMERRRIPRKYKKLLKKAAAIKFKEIDYDYKIICSVSFTSSIYLKCGDKQITLLFKAQQQKLLNLLKN